MKIRKVSGCWVKSKKDQNKKLFFLNVDGEGTIRFRAVYMYSNGKRKLLRVVGMLNGMQADELRVVAEKLMKGGRNGDNKK